MLGATLTTWTTYAHIIFFLLSATLLGFVAKSIYKKRLQGRKTQFVLLGFTMLILSNILFVLEPYHKFFYVAGTAITLLAYLSILAGCFLPKKHTIQTTH